MISARSNESKAKMLRFFGEESVPVKSGGGSNNKVTRFLMGSMFGTGASSTNRAIATPERQLMETHSLTSSSSFTEDPPSAPTRSSSIISTSDTLLTATQMGSVLGSVEIPRSVYHLRPRTLPFLVHQSRSDLGGGGGASLNSGATMQNHSLDTHVFLYDNDSEEQFSTGPSISSDSSLLRVPSTESIEYGGMIMVRPLPSLATSVGKVNKVLGLDVNLDVSVKEIASYTDLHQGLMRLLESKMPLCYFLLFLIEKGGFEELFFVCDVLSFEQTVFNSPQAQTVSSRKIFQNYFSSVSDDRRFSTMKVPASVLRSVIVGIQNGSRSCFAVAQSRAFCDLTFMFAKFKQSSIWNKMETDLGNVRIPTRMQYENIKALLSLAITEAAGYGAFAAASLVSEAEFKGRVMEASFGFVDSKRV